MQANLIDELNTFQLGIRGAFPGQTRLALAPDPPSSGSGPTHSRLRIPLRIHSPIGRPNGLAPLDQVHNVDAGLGRAARPFQRHRPWGKTRPVRRPSDTKPHIPAGWRPSA